MNLSYRFFIGFIIVIIALKLCCPKENHPIAANFTVNAALLPAQITDTVTIKKAIRIESYFPFIDSIVKRYDSLTSYTLSEHLLIRANPWIIDTLQNTDYYKMMARDSFTYDQKKMIVLPEGAFLLIPNAVKAKKIQKAFHNTRIDINIPEFKLRIHEDSILLYELPIRVGRNERKYLAMSGRIEDLRTKTGHGFIIDHIRHPRYVNPSNNHEYLVTKRDDNKITKLPQIPFIETELNGVRYGQLIHPTTNPITLGKAYSNGCIGVSEADAWLIYYHAPIGTKIVIRYDLKVMDSSDNKIMLKDIYNYEN